MAKTKISQKYVDSLPAAALGVLCMHLQGIDVKKKVSEPTFYKYKTIFAPLGYDLTKPLGSPK